MCRVREREELVMAPRFFGLSIRNCEVAIYSYLLRWSRRN